MLLTHSTIKQQLALTPYKIIKYGGLIFKNMCCYKIEYKNSYNEVRSMALLSDFVLV